MERIKQMPVVGNLVTLVDHYPRISAWVVLSVGIIAILIYEARDVGLTFTNWVALIVASIVVAGLCIWIVSWEDEDEQALEAAQKKDEPKASDAAASASAANQGEVDSKA